MVQKYRRGFTTAERTEMWDRWQRGKSLRAIGRTFGKPSSSIYGQLSPHGGHCQIKTYFDVDRLNP
jgi:IS30 family transposase